MSVLSSLLFAITANADNFVVGLSNGINEIKVGPFSNFIISIISMAGTIISMSLSKIIVNFIPEYVSNFLGSIMLVLIGGWTIAKPLLSNINSEGILDNPEKADKDNSSHIDIKESVALGFALTINNVGLGIGASITGLGILMTSIFTFIFSLLMIRLGHILGSDYLSKVFGKWATIISGLLIVALGVFEIYV